MQGLRGIVLTIRFLCELALLAALAYWGFNTGDGIGAWVLGLGVPLVAVVIWGAFVAPKAKRPVSVPVRLIIELVLFGAAVIGLVDVDQPVLAAVLAVAAVVTSVLNAATARVEHPWVE